MRVLLAGATGAIGRPLLPMLVAAGHEVHAVTRAAGKAGSLTEAGASVEIADLLEPGAAEAVVARVQPEVVIDQLTSLPQDFDPRKSKAAYAANDRIRREGSGALIAAAEAHGVGRYICQSVAFMYQPGAPGLRSEADPVWSDAPAPFDRSIEVVVENERKVTQSKVFAGVILRYGFLYGPGTWYETDGSTYAAVLKRQYPVVGSGAGVPPLIHVYDAATATLAALDRGAGIFNVVDDDPAPYGELIPVYAELIGAKRPRNLPRWLVRMIAGEYLATAATTLPAVGNQRIKDELGWAPRLASWRDGLRDYRDSMPEPAGR